MGNKNKNNDNNNTSNEEMMKEIKEESIVINDKNKTEELTEEVETEPKEEVEQSKITEPKEEVETQVDKKAKEVKQTQLEENQYKVSCGRFVDEKNNAFEFDEVVTLTKKQIERYTQLNIIGNQLRN